MVGLRFPVGARDFSLLYIVQTGSGNQLASSAIGTGVVKLPGREADHSLPSNIEAKNGGSILPLLIRLHGVVLN
jgi:hypothetical protein